MHDINVKQINLRYIVLFSFCFFDFIFFVCTRPGSMRLSINLSLKLFIWKQQITFMTITIFFCRHSRRLHHTSTSNRRCTLKRCSVITVQGCLLLSYLRSLFFFCFCAHTHSSFSAQSSLAYVFGISGEDE